jgi:hypothetical protein
MTTDDFFHCNNNVRNCLVGRSSVITSLAVCGELVVCVVPVMGFQPLTVVEAVLQ